MSELNLGGAGDGTDAITGGSPSSTESAGGITRRRMVGYLIAAPTLVAAARWADPAEAAVPTVQLSDTFDLSDLLNLAAATTANLVSVRVNSDGTASFDLHRAEVGQGITTATAMIIADEMDIPLDRVKITLADARPELVFNQLTGGSNSMHSIYTPVRTAAATARGQPCRRRRPRSACRSSTSPRATASSPPATGAPRRTARSPSRLR